MRSCNGPRVLASLNLLTGHNSSLQAHPLLEHTLPWNMIEFFKKEEGGHWTLHPVNPLVHPHTSLRSWRELGNSLEHPGLSFLHCKVKSVIVIMWLAIIKIHMRCYSYVRCICISDGSHHMHKALRTVCGTPQAPSHTTIIAIIKIRTEETPWWPGRSTRDCVKCEGRTSTGLGSASFRGLRPHRAWLEI